MVGRGVLISGVVIGLLSLSLNGYLLLAARANPVLQQAFFGETVTEVVTGAVTQSTGQRLTLKNEQGTRSFTLPAMVPIVFTSPQPTPGFLPPLTADRSALTDGTMVNLTLARRPLRRPSVAGIAVMTDRLLLAQLKAIEGQSLTVTVQDVSGQITDRTLALTDSPSWQMLGDDGRTTDATTADLTPGDGLEILLSAPVTDDTARIERGLIVHVPTQLIQGGSQ